MAKKLKLNDELVCPSCQVKNNSQLKYRVLGYEIFVCNWCTNGFVYPVPGDMGEFYPENYWQAEGVTGKIKERVYGYFQDRRADWVRKFVKRGDVLDVGAGEGLFAGKLAGEFEVTSMDFPGSKIRNPNVLREDFVSWKTDKKFDGIVYWECMEHVPDPHNYIKKTFYLLKPGGIVIIECPDFGSAESGFFGRHWYHLDPPRHLVHFTKTGIKKILEQQGFEVISQKPVFAPEYMFSGFMVSLFRYFGVDLMGIYLKKGSILIILAIALVFSPLLLAGFLLEILMCFFGQSPIMRVAARKNIR